MMDSPQNYVERLANKSYDELLIERDRFYYTRRFK